MLDIAVLRTEATTLNARVAAVSLAFGAFASLLLTHTSVALSPLRLVTLTVVTFAVWAFVDEMGVRKPLNRAGFVCFAIAVVCKVLLLLGVEPDIQSRYLLLYSSFLLISVMFWSIAFLHRKRNLKLVGAVGLLGAMLPLSVILLGHLALGVSTFMGVDAIVSASTSTGSVDVSFVTTVERIFGLWAYVAAWMLWKGQIVDKRTSSGAA